MARSNPRPDIVYVRDLSESDKDIFENLLKTLPNNTSNSEALLITLRKYLPLQKEKTELQEEIKKLNATIGVKEKKLNLMSEQKSKMLEQIGIIEKTLNESKEFIKEL
ncbi:MAG: hypothetical protein ABI554_10705 [Flavobacterium sp.]